MSDFNDLFGVQYAEETGYSVKVGNGQHLHLFGGDEWTMIEEEPIGHGPTTIVTLDLSDPVLSKYKDMKIERLPLCSYLNCVWYGRQIYQITKDTNQIYYFQRNRKQIELISSEYLLQMPFPVKKLILRPLEKGEYPLDENAYWNCCDEFLGGKSVIRIMGPPIWIQEIEKVKCDCGKDMEYLASIGYEVDNEFREFIDEEPFFPGEMAHYYFICKDCLKIAVVQQST